MLISNGADRTRSRATAAFVRTDLLRWIYLARITLVSGIQLGAFYQWLEALPEQTLLATAMFVSSLVITGTSFWYTHILRRRPGNNFLYGQAILDVLLVTGVVHITLGAESDFAWVYILVITEGALLLPLLGGVLIGALASILYLADIYFSASLTGAVLLQIGLFALVALATGIVGDRLRHAGMTLGTVQSELRRLKMDTGDILATISTGIVTLEEDGRLVYMNPAAESLLRLDSRQWVGAPVLREIERASPGLAEILRTSLSGGQTHFRRRAKAGAGDEEITLGISTTVREEPDEPRAVTAIFQDITDLERIEALNLRNERLEAVAELSAAMAHEIKNPLASIRSAVEQFEAPNLRNEDRGILTRMVVRETERLSRLLTDFIDFARVRIGRLAPVKVEELVRECVVVVQRHPEASERGVEVRLGPIDPSVCVLGDADLLHRALLNLLLNAVQFSPDGESVTLTVEAVHGEEGLGVPTPIRIQIRDSGPGIPDEDRERIFDPFFTTRKGGSGLGLSVVHRAVEAHGGAILVAKAPQGGAEFNVYLPAMTAEDGGYISGGEIGDE